MFLLHNLLVYIRCRLHYVLVASQTIYVMILMKYCSIGLEHTSSKNNIEMINKKQQAYNSLDENEIKEQLSNVKIHNKAE